MADNTVVTRSLREDLLWAISVETDPDVAQWIREIVGGDAKQEEEMAATEKRWKEATETERVRRGNLIQAKWDALAESERKRLVGQEKKAKQRAKRELANAFVDFKTKTKGSQ